MEPINNELMQLSICEINTHVTSFLRTEFMHIHGTHTYSSNENVQGVI